MATSSSHEIDLCEVSCGISNREDASNERSEDFTEAEAREADAEDFTGVESQEDGRSEGLAGMDSRQHGRKGENPQQDGSSEDQIQMQVDQVLEDAIVSSSQEEALHLQPDWEGATVEVPPDDVPMPDWHDDAIDLTCPNSQSCSPHGALSQDLSPPISQDIKPDIQPFVSYPPAVPLAVPVPEPAAEPGAGADRGAGTRPGAAASGGEEGVSGPGGAEEGAARGGMAAAGGGTSGECRGGGGAGGAGAGSTPEVVGGVAFFGAGTGIDSHTGAHTAFGAGAGIDTHTAADTAFGAGADSASGLHTQPCSMDIDMHAPLSPDVRLLSLRHQEDSCHESAHEGNDHHLPPPGPNVAVREAGTPPESEATDEGNTLTAPVPTHAAPEVAAATAAATADATAAAREPVAAERISDPGSGMAPAPAADVADEPAAVAADDPSADVADEPAAVVADEHVADVVGKATGCKAGEPAADVASEPVADVAVEAAADMTQVEEGRPEEARWLSTDSFGSFGYSSLQPASQEFPDSSDLFPLPSDHARTTWHDQAGNRAASNEDAEGTEGKGVNAEDRNGDVGGGSRQGNTREEQVGGEGEGGGDGGREGESGNSEEGRVAESCEKKEERGKETAEGAELEGGKEGVGGEKGAGASKVCIVEAETNEVEMERKSFPDGGDGPLVERDTEREGGVRVEQDVGEQGRRAGKGGGEKEGERAGEAVKFQDEPAGEEIEIGEEVSEGKEKEMGEEREVGKEKGLGEGDEVGGEEMGDERKEGEEVRDERRDGEEEDAVGAEKNDDGGPMPVDGLDGDGRRPLSEPREGRNAGGKDKREREEKEGERGGGDDVDMSDAGVKPTFEAWLPVDAAEEPSFETQQMKDAADGGAGESLDAAAGATTAPSADVTMGVDGDSGDAGEVGGAAVEARGEEGMEERRREERVGGVSTAYGTFTRFAKSHLVVGTSVNAGSDGGGGGGAGSIDTQEDKEGGYGDAPAEEDGDVPAASASRVPAADAPGSAAPAPTHPSGLPSEPAVDEEETQLGVGEEANEGGIEEAEVVASVKRGKEVQEEAQGETVEDKVEEDEEGGQKLAVSERGAGEGGGGDGEREADEDERYLVVEVGGMKGGVTMEVGGVGGGLAVAVDGVREGEEGMEARVGLSADGEIRDGEEGTGEEQTGQEGVAGGGRAVREGAAFGAPQEQDGVAGPNSAVREGVEAPGEAVAVGDRMEGGAGEGGQGAGEAEGGGALGRGETGAVVSGAGARAAAAISAALLGSRQISELEVSASVKVDLPEGTAAAAQTVAKALAARMAGQVAAAMGAGLDEANMRPGSAIRGQNNVTEREAGRAPVRDGDVLQGDVLFRSSHIAQVPAAGEASAAEEMEFDVMVIGRRRKSSGTPAGTPTATPRDGRGHARIDAAEGGLDGSPLGISKGRKRARGLQGEGRSRREEDNIEKPLFVEPLPRGGATGANVTTGPARAATCGKPARVSAFAGGPRAGGVPLATPDAPIARSAPASEPPPARKKWWQELYDSPSAGGSLRRDSLGGISGRNAASQIDPSWDLLDVMMNAGVSLPLPARRGRHRPQF
ncbi:hypothetical protein CLOM_g12279 [Closterium sp. NIES-68]|nr:hypothetical protein CLOM_g12279 [Closterium sp. NIES-68]GJP86536.1 hypothetical protein CLOP_g16549 [Closterium sp. NIES-67]